MTSPALVLRKVFPARDSRLGRLALGGAVVGAAAGVAAVGVLLTAYLLQGRWLFRPVRDNEHTFADTLHRRIDPVELRIDAKVTLRGWQLTPKVTSGKIPGLIYFGGRQEDISELARVTELFGTRVVRIFNHRGFASSSGKPSEKGLLSDALAQYDALVAAPEVDPSNVTVIGRSLGSGLAVYLAAHRPVAGVVLITPYDSILALARRHYPYLPVKQLLRHRFEAHVWAGKARCRVLTILAATDKVVPAHHSHQLLAHWVGSSEFITIPDTDHSSVLHAEQTQSAIRQFLQATPPALIS
jgi:pimeloyl-ACP methyl ester carboxylesterase